VAMVVDMNCFAMGLLIAAGWTTLSK
jgi:hypothetical protein